MLRLVRPEVDPFVDFTISNQADGKSVSDQGGQKRGRLLLALEVINDKVAIDQVSHSSTGGREDLRRLS
jgi:hypothetical protein